MNILQILPYPIIEPIHGGQIRAKSIYTNLIQNGHNVITVSIYDPNSGYITGDYDIPFNTEDLSYDIYHPKVMDYIIGVTATDSLFIQTHITNLIKEFQIEAVMLEQPWFYYLIKNINIHHPIKLIYSSQNIEYKLKQAMLNLEELGDSVYIDYIDKIRELEKTIVLASDLIICCTQQDNLYYTTLLTDNKLNTAVITAGNGVNPFDKDETQIEYWKNFIKRPYAVFVGSAHEPNSNGFWQMVYPGLTFLAPDEEIIVIGGVCNILLDNPLEKNFTDLNRSRLHLMGKRDLKELQSLVLASHLVILPICEGEGSNLKTAEALESGRPIVSTSKAFRGYEDAMSLSHVYIEDEPLKFRQRIRTLLDSPRYVEETPFEIRSKYYWSSQLKDINFYITKL